MNRSLVLLLLALPVLGCPTSSGDDDDSAEIGDDDDSTPYEMPGEWRDLDFDQRKEFMEEVVLPTMRPLFAEQDPDEYPEIVCETCHGYAAEAIDYEMPNGVTALDIGDWPTQSNDARLRDMAEFMEDEVVPRFGEWFGRGVRSIANPSGVGCFDCHEEQ
jgi:hypothetical protein